MSLETLDYKVTQLRARITRRFVHMEEPTGLLGYNADWGTGRLDLWGISLVPCTFAATDLFEMGMSPIETVWILIHFAHSLLVDN